MNQKLILSLLVVVLAIGGASQEVTATDLCSGGVCQETLESTEPEMAYVSNEILIKLRPEAAGRLRDRQSPEARDTGLGSVDGLNRDHSAVRMEKVAKEGEKTRKAPGLSRWYKITFPGEREVVREGLEGPPGRLKGILAGYQADPHIEYAQPNFVYEPDVIPDDPLFPSQYSHANTEAELGWDIETGDPDVTIAVIGTGVYWEHEDLVSNIWANTGEIPDNGEDDDGNGYIDDARGWNFYDGSNEILDWGGHETKVAGVAAASTNNALGVAGVCWQCTIMPLVVSYTSEDVRDALDYATDNGANVVNMSFSNSASVKYGPDSIVKESVDRAHDENLVLVATAGNTSNDGIRYPSGLDNVMAITATDSGDQRAAYSTFGSWVDVAAPGSAIFTTNRDGGYDSSSSGTSFSAPYVAGMAGLILSKNPGLSNDTVRLIIDYTADKIDSDLFIGGRVNVYGALQQDDVPQLYAVVKSPYNGSAVFGDTVDFYGTALGDSYVVDYRPSPSGTWIQVGSGPQTIDGVLATLDTSPLEHGAYYDIRLTSSKDASTDSDTIQIRVFKSGQDFQEGWPTSVGSAIVGPPSYADIDDDGDLEVFFGANDGHVYAFHHDAAPVDGWPRKIAIYAFASPTIYDIDGDGDLEVIVGAHGKLLWAFHDNGSWVDGWPVPLGDYIYSTPAVADLDNDGDVEVMVGTDAGDFLVWDLPGPYDPSRAPWPMFQHHAQHTGCVQPCYQQPPPTPTPTATSTPTPTGTPPTSTPTHTPTPTGPWCPGGICQWWVARYDGPPSAYDFGAALALGPSGNVYVTGRSEGSGTRTDYATVKYGPDGSELWVARYDGPGSYDDEAWALEVDESGNVYVSGMSYGSGTSGDYATIKYGPDGSEQWVTRYDGPASAKDSAVALALDASGNVYVTGSSIGSGTNRDYATVKYGPDGSELWVARYDGPDSDLDWAEALAVDGSGNVYVSGRSYGSGTGADYATIKYGPDGSEQWVARYDGPAGAGEHANALAIDASGNVYVTGWSEGSGTGPDYATVKYGPDGSELWVARHNGPASQTDMPKDLAVDASGNVYVSGTTYDLATNFDYTTIKYGPDGSELWLARYDGPISALDGAAALAVDGSGNVYVTGRSQGTHFDLDYATVKYGPDGSELWVDRYDGPGSYDDDAKALALDGSGNVHVTGVSQASGSGADYATIKYAPDTDTDGDGCTDSEEQAMGFDPLVWYDFYDVPVPANPDPTPNGARNQVIDISDVLAVLFYAGADDDGPSNANGVDYDSDKDGDTVEDGQAYDRSPGPDPDPATGVDPAGPPNGAIDMGDVLAALAQAFVVECSAAP